MHAGCDNVQISIKAFLFTKLEMQNYCYTCMSYNQKCWVTTYVILTCSSRAFYVKLTVCTVLASHIY